MYSKMEKKYHIVGTTPKSNIIVVERDKIDTPSTKQNMTVHFNLCTSDQEIIHYRITPIRTIKH